MSRVALLLALAGSIIGFLRPVSAQIETCAWTTLNLGPQTMYPGMPVLALAPYDDGSGEQLYAGGTIFAVGADGVPSRGIARWDGSRWTGVRGGVNGAAFFNFVSLLTVFDDGSGPGLYVGGVFADAGGEWSPGFARYDANGWSALGLDASGAAVMAATPFDSGTGTTLHVAGQFASIAGFPARCVARLDHGAWTDMGQGLITPGGAPLVRDLVVHDDGSGERLYAAGAFDVAGQGPGGGIARWDGQSWSLVGGGVMVPNAPLIPQGANRLASFDDGSGPALYASGAFNSAGGAPISGVAKWDGNAWSAVGGGFSGSSTSFAPICRILGSFDDGIRPKLAVTSTHLQAGGTTITNKLALWDGVAWSSPGSGSGAGLPAPNFYSMQVWDDRSGSGPALYVGASVGAANPVASSEVIKLGCALPPSIRVSQPAGAGGAVWLSNANLTPGHAYRNLFSLTPSPAGMPGPFLGLSFADPGALIAQLMLPPGTPPFTFKAASGYAVWGPFLHPPASIEAVCADVTGGTLGAYSAPVTIVVQ